MSDSGHSGEATWVATQSPDSAALLGSEATVASGAVAGPVGVGATPSDRFARGKLLGRYLIIDRLGAGAMGVVLAAYDPELDRRVALKVLAGRAGRGQETSAGRARMQREAQSMARLSHPNVVSVFDVGIHGDEIFIAMELVEGVTLKTWLAQSPRSRDEILRVYLAAAHGLQAAHVAGVVHRDFKPDNVMVDSAGRARVMDFGLARPEIVTRTGTLPASSGALETSGDLTMTGALMGTPAYMAPEQFEGQPADAAADQFAFCVALWEALSGERPFRGRTFAELAAQVCSETPLPAVPGSRMPPHLRAALTRGLQRSAGRRYPDMGALILALESDPLPRRRRIIAAVTLPSILAVMAGGVVLADRMEAASCEHAAQRLRTQWEQELMPAAREGVAAALATAGLDAKVWPSTEASVERFLDAWEQADADLCAGRGGFAGADAERTAKARECLEERADALTALGEALRTPDVLAAVAAAPLADRLPAVEDCTDPATLSSRPMLPSSETTREEVRSIRRDIFANSVLLRGGAPRRAHDQALKILQRAQATQWPPVENEAMVALGHAQQADGAAEEAERSFSRSYYESARIADDRLAAEAATALTALVGDELGRPRDGAFWRELAIEALDRSGRNSGLARAALLMASASLDYRNGDYEQGVERLEEALAIRRDVYGDEHPSTAAVRTTLGIYLRDVGKSERAREELDLALAIYDRVYGRNHPDSARAMSALGTLAFLAKDFDVARDRYQMAVAAWEASLGADHPDVAIGLNNLASAHWALEEFDLAIAQYQRANALVERAFGSPHPDLATGEDNLGLALYAARKDREALDAFERALAGWLALELRETVACADTYLHRARAQSRLGMHAAARESAALASAIHSRVFDPIDVRVGLDQLELARSCRMLGQQTEAKVAAQTSVEILSAAGTEPDALQEALKLASEIDAGVAVAPGDLDISAEAPPLLPVAGGAGTVGDGRGAGRTASEKRDKAKVRDKPSGGSSSEPFGNIDDL